MVCLWPALTFAQSNPCAAPLPPLTLVTSTAKVAAAFADFQSNFNGQPVWTDTELAVFTKGADPKTAIPVTGQAIPKSQWFLLGGTTNCYSTSTPFLFGVTPNQEYDLWIRAKGSEVGGWGGPVPFGRTGPPAVPMEIRITP